jgi:hypothetical protein
MNTLPVAPARTRPARTAPLRGEGRTGRVGGPRGDETGTIVPVVLTVVPVVFCIVLYIRRLHPRTRPVRLRCRTGLVWNWRPVRTAFHPEHDRYDPEFVPVVLFTRCVEDRFFTIFALVDVLLFEKLFCVCR